MADGAAMLEWAERIDRDRALELRSRLSGVFADDPLGHAAATLLGTAYPATAPVLAAHPEAVPKLSPSTAHQRNERLAALMTRLNRDAAPDLLRAELRQVARDVRMRVALRELLPADLGGADVEETARELSDLADVTISAALSEAERHEFAACGTPRRADGQQSRLVVLGMGKLGGRELNAGSDVDLACFYDTDEAHALGPGGRRRSSHEIWTRVVRRMTTTLDEVTEDGFVWRVDLRLRPEGAGGPLVNSLAAAERYYESFGRVWERAALLRARPVAGDMRLGASLLELLEPFVWSRRVDPSVAEVMIELTHRARAQLGHPATDDLKLGPGGIREAEFFVQTLQLIWGGRDHRLRATSTLQGLTRLRAAGCVTEREELDLTSAYLTLRRAEHAVQFSTGLQTHALPDRSAELRRLARSLGYADTNAFCGQLRQHTSRVHQLFTSLLPAGQPTPSPWLETLAALEAQDADRFARAVERAGLIVASPSGAEQLARALFELSRHPDAPLGVRSRERHRQLPAELLSAIADAAEPERAAHYLRRFYARVRHPAIYTKHLASDPTRVRRWVTVLGASAFVGEAVAAQPELADLLLFAQEPPTPEAARDEVEQAAREPLDVGDSILEQQAGLLRRAQHRIVTQVALTDLAGELTARAAALTLSALADASLEAAAHFAMGLEPDAPVRGLTILAMGKLGGSEVGYGSDLDVIFLFDPAAAPGDGLAFFSRCARRIIQLISMPHAEGPGYELDTRLRPSGSQGLLVVSLEGFARYHDVPASSGASNAPSAAASPRLETHGRRAATWERLALLKARFAAGDRELGRAAVGVAHEAAYGRRASLASTARDVHRLRQRMEHELARERPGRYDVKFGRGGLVDIEFCVQLLQLQHGAEESVRTTDTAHAIESLAAIGALQEQHAAWLREGLTFLRDLEQRMRVVHGQSSHLIEAEAAGFGALARRMGIRDRPHDEAAATLLQRYLETTSQIRQCYEDIVVAATARS